jgi:methionyl aminopeptidase
MNDAEIYKNYKKTKSGIIIHEEKDFEGMRKAGLLARQTLDYISTFIQDGISTEKLDKLCHDFIIQNNAIPAPLNYRGFPKSICTSINNVVCHGIPKEADVLKMGDILNIDVTVILDGYYGDTSRMFFVGKPSPMAERLCKVTFEAMMLGIEKAKVGNKIREIGIAIQNHVEKNGYSCVRDFCGHGVGKIFHMEPQIIHYNETKSVYQEITIEEGMFFTIEPMVNAGKYQVVLSKEDGWTATTKDKSLSAQYEHTIGIKQNGNEIFTL